MFFLTPEDAEDKPKKKPPVIPRNKNGSPPKKTVAGKVLRNQTRRTQDEVHQTAAAKLAEHQRELHDQLQAAGVEKYSEEGEGKEGKEGKGWKKFQSYKGEAGLPGEVEKLRVSTTLQDAEKDLIFPLDTCRSQSAVRHPAHSWIRGTLPHQYHQKCE
jgi:nucleosome binding factor SPN SPT16 subunit